MAWPRANLSRSTRRRPPAHDEHRQRAVALCERGAADILAAEVADIVRPRQRGKGGAGIDLARWCDRLNARRATDVRAEVILPSSDGIHARVRRSGMEPGA